MPPEATTVPGKRGGVGMLVEPAPPFIQASRLGATIVM